MKTSEMIAMLEEYGIKEEPGKYGMPHWVEFRRKDEEGGELNGA